MQDDVSVENVRAHVRHITQNIPSRLAGSDNGRRMAEYSRDALQEAGLQARVIEIPGLVSFPENTTIHVQTPRKWSIEATTLGHSLPTGPEAVSGELIDLRSGSFADYEGIDAKGKIVLLELSYSPARQEKQRIAALKGAIGCLMMNWGHAENEALPFGSVKPAWGNPTPETLANEMPTLPCVGLSRKDGLKLRQLTAAGTVRVSFRAIVENGWRPVHLTTAEIASPKSEDFVLFGGHQDSWPGEQATDNAAGSACIIELARAINMHRDKLERGVVIGLWPGHETGTMIGSTWFADHNWDRLKKNAVAYFQIDQPACLGTTGWKTSSSAELKPFHEAIEARHLASRKSVWHRALKNGDRSFFGVGLPTLSGEGAFTAEELAQTAQATLGWWHHSVHNTFDKLDWAYMDTHLRIYAAYLWELCTAKILPYDFTSSVGDLEARLRTLAEADLPIGLEAAIEQAVELKKDAAHLNQLADQWRERYRQGHSDPQPAELLNECMKGLSRELVPIASSAIGSYGQDPYGYTPQTTVIPCLYDALLLRQVDRNSEDYLTRHTQLIRNRNRVVDALIGARALIRGVRSHLS